MHPPLTAEQRTLLKAAIDREVRRRIGDPRTIGASEWYEDRLILEAHREMVRQQQIAVLARNSKVSHARAMHRKRQHRYRQRFVAQGLTTRGQPRRVAA